MHKVFSFCNLDYTFKMMDEIKDNLSKRKIAKILRPRIDVTRALNYRKEDFDLVNNVKRYCEKVGYRTLFNRLNEIGETEYENR